MTLKEHVRCPYIDKAELEKYSVFEKMQCFEEKGFHWEVLDCTCNNKYPVVGLLILDKKRSKYSLVLGADIDFEIAWERCITELLQGRVLDNLSANMKMIDFEKIDNNNITWCVENQSDYYDFIDNYIMNSGNNPTYLFFEPDHVAVPSIFKSLTNNVDAFKYMQEIVRKNELKMYIADFSYLGFPTYRVYIPKLSKVFDTDDQSFEFVDALHRNIGLLMKMNELTDSEKNELVSSLKKLSNNPELFTDQFLSLKPLCES